MSIKLKISFWFTLIVTIILLILNSSVYYFNSHDRRNTFEKRLKNRALSIAHLYSSLGDNKLAVLQHLDSIGVAALYNKSVLILDRTGNPIYRYAEEGDHLNFQDKTEAIKEDGELYFTQNKKEAVAIFYSAGSKNFIAAVAAYDKDGLERLEKLKQLLIISFVAGIVIALFLGYAFASRLVKPIAGMTQQANLITSSNLSQRIEAGEKKDELHQLAATLNHLLDRLQESFQIQRRFISNASHELSTPLTSISSQIEVALQKERNIDEYKQVMASVQEDVLQLQQLTRSLLEIAKAGSQGSIDLKEVRVDEVLLKAVSDVKKQNADYDVNLSFDDYPEEEQLIEVFGNADLLYSALKNLLENGCKYSDDRKAVAFISFPHRQVLIRISSKGDVIAEADIQHIFQPFFRSGTVQQKPGFGLGLTLTKRIISLHRGTIEVSSDPEKGTTFSISLPSMASFK